ncbi:MAG: ABC transporter substrate-binding protein [Candidatus Bathyarchaeia archaeon]
MASSKSQSSTRVVVFLIIGLIVGAALGYSGAAFSQKPSVPTKTMTYTIGIVTDLSGGGESFGKETLTAAQIALGEINSNLAQSGSNVRFALSSPQDSLTTTDGAVSAVQTLASAGDTIILCHCWSGQLSAIESYANSNDIVVVSVSSTSNLLAVPKGYLFRLIAPDSFQGKALSTLLWHDGVRKVAVIYRDDPYGQGISAVLKTDFTGLGGTVSLEAYEPSLADYASEVVTLSTNVKSLGVGPQTAVLFVGFAAEAVNIFTHASVDSTLTQVRWFSSEGPKGPDILPPKVPDAIGSFEVQTSLTGTFPQSITPNSIEDSFLTAFQSASGSAPMAYGEQAYDGIYLLANTILNVGSYNSTAVKNMLPIIAQHMFGASGPMQLDSNGDRATQDYVVWTVARSQTAYNFVNIGGWSGSTGVLTMGS